MMITLQPRLPNQRLAVFPAGCTDHFPVREGTCTGKGGAEEDNGE